MKNKVVVIVPYFNGKDFIERCFKSIENQTYRNIDVICIDDGSSDNSFEIADNYKWNKKINVINYKQEKNGGLSSARNCGLRLAFEKYNPEETFVAFLDIDDYIAPEYIQTLVDMCLTNNADIASTSLFYAMSSGNYKHVIFQDRDDTTLVMNNFDAVVNILKDHKITSWVPTKLFKLKLFKNIEFPVEARCYEDRMTTYKLFINSNKVAFSNYCGYFYNQVSTNSITRSKQQNSKKLMSLESYLSCVKYDYSQKYSKKECKQLVRAAKEGYLNTLLMIIGNFEYGNKDDDLKLKYYEKQIKLSDLFKYKPEKKKNKKKKWAYILLKPIYVSLYKKWLVKHREN